MRLKKYAPLLVIFAFLGTAFLIKNVQAAQEQLYTMASFVDVLIEKGLIDVADEGKARKLVDFMLIANAEKESSTV